MDAYESLSRADRAAPLGAEDLELLATSAYMLGRDDDLSILERAYHEYLDAGEALRAARCAIWVGMTSRPSGERWAARPDGSAARGGWSNARGVNASSRAICCSRSCFGTRPAVTTRPRVATAADAAEIGERFGDARSVRPRHTSAGHPPGQTRVGSWRVSGCWTRRWWRSPRGSSRRSSAVWSIAA